MKIRPLIVSRWDDCRILPSLHLCQQVDTEGNLQERGAIVLNWLYWSVALPLVDVA